jgi:hypothetical protein
MVTQKKSHYTYIFGIIYMNSYQKRKLNDFQEYFFNSFIIITYILLILSFLGLSDSAPKYLNTLDYYIRIYICLFLIWRFNPLRSNYEFTDLDRKIAFSAGAFILTTTALNQYLVGFQEKIKSLL